ncbi:MAG TPA: tetratricopeptide repeat protein [Terriglobales bacterium]|nr:tetratricopeptide repeat protein [Terriglobales bacterium]
MIQLLPLTRILAALLPLTLVISGTPGAASQRAPAAQLAPPDSPDAHLGRAYDALRNDKYEMAAAEFRAALKLDPKLTLRARFPLAVALFEMKKPEEARREFESVRREAGDHANISYYLGRLDLDELHYESAIQNLNQAIAQPPFPDTAYYLGFAHFKQGDLAAAEKWLKEAAHSNPHDARVQYQLSLVYRKQGREQEAKQAMALSGEQRQSDSSQSQLRLECAQKLDQAPREEAHSICEQLYDPDDAEKLTELGTIYGQHGDVEAALKPLRRAAELAPQSPQMQYNLALAYYQLNQFEEARAPLGNAVTRWPDIFQLAALYGAVLSKLGEDLSAYQALQHAHELNAQDAATADLLYLTTLSLGRKAQSARQYPEALRYFQEAAKLKAQEPSPHRGLAEIYKLTGRSAQATTEQRVADRLASAFEKTR